MDRSIGDGDCFYAIEHKCETAVFYLADRVKLHHKQDLQEKMKQKAPLNELVEGRSAGAGEEVTFQKFKDYYWKRFGYN